MDVIRFAIDNPVKVTVGVLLTLLAGGLALTRIPIQLTPDVEAPTITVETNWIGRSPQEVEKEIVEEQEERLSGLSNLKKMTAVASEGKSEITLEFFVGTDIDQAYGETSDKLREVPEYPPDVDEPVITQADASSANAIAWIVLTCEDPDFDIQGFYDTADKRIKPLLENVPGVAEVNIYGGREREVQVRINPQQLAQRGITFNQLRNALRLDNVNISAGQLTDGKYDVRVRTVNQYDNLDEIRDTIITYTAGGPVRVRDVGDVVLTLTKRRGFVRSRGNPAMAFQVVRKVGANVMETMRGEGGVHDTVKRLEKDVLPQLVQEQDLQGALHIEQVYDETVYIDSSINLVQSNLIIGGSLAILILLLFLRVIRPTIIIAIAIPISVVGTFVVMTLMGRNINVISLAGLAFAVGMVVDNAIVVLENIDRHLNMGKKPLAAAYDATREVWGAVLASTLTTLVVFLPVIFMQEEAGQLFRDISIAICAAVSLSLIVSVTVIPSAGARWLRARTKKHGKLWVIVHTVFGLTVFLQWMSDAYAKLIHKMTAPNFFAWTVRVAIVGCLTAVSLIGAYLLMPPTTYLPNGNRNLVFGIMFAPPGYNLDQNEFIGERVEHYIRPYWEAENYDETDRLPRPPSIADMPHIPPIENFFFVSFSSSIFMGASSADPENVQPLGTLLSTSMSDAVPGTFGMAQQRSLFARGLQAGNTIDVELTGTDLDELKDAAAALQQQLAAKYGFMNVRSQPMNFNLAGREQQIKPDRITAQDLGVDTTALGQAVAALVDGITVGDYRERGDSIDLRLIRHPDFPISVDTLSMIPVATRNADGSIGAVVPLSSVTRITPADAPQEIRRINQLRAIQMQVTPSREVALQTIEDEAKAIVAQLRQTDRPGQPGVKMMPPTISANMAGTADKLTQVRNTLLGSREGSTTDQLISLLNSRMFLALVVVYLLMAALFESFLYPFVIMFSVPLATVGGFIGLSIAHRYDPLQLLDVLTMLGFVILIGVVVNNAILIVHQALNFMRGTSDSDEHRHERLGPRDAISEAVRTRVRPIFMTTMTSVFGMMPLVLAPGAGSELYKGLGSVVVGGLIVATVFILVVVPLLLSITFDARSFIVSLFAAKSADEPETAGAAG